MLIAVAFLCVHLVCGSVQLKDKREKNRAKDAWSESDAIAKQAAEDEELAAAAEAPIVAVLPPAAAQVGGGRGYCRLEWHFANVTFIM